MVQVSVCSKFCTTVTVRLDTCANFVPRVRALQVRKLEFLMQHILESGADTVVTIGGVQSNHCRAVSAVCAMLGVESHLILRTDGGQSPNEDPGCVVILL